MNFLKNKWIQLTAWLLLIVSTAYLIVAGFTQGEISAVTGATIGIVGAVTELVIIIAGLINKKDK